MADTTHDYLSEDSPVTGQKFVCMSFVSPAEVLPTKDAFFFENYIDDVHVQKIRTFADAVKETPARAEEFAATLTATLARIDDDFRAYLNTNSVRLEEKYAQAHPLKVTMSGFKVRGSFPTLEAARKQAEKLQKNDKHFDVFVAQVGAWCPWCPRAESVGEVVYDESELNALMREKVKLEEKKDEMFAEVWNKDAEVK
jgi:hypothetical protein